MNADKEKSVIFLKDAIIKLENISDSQIETFVSDIFNEENKMES